MLWYSWSLYLFLLIIARDFGPRLTTYYYGWGMISFQGAWVYFIAPLGRV